MLYLLTCVGGLPTKLEDEPMSTKNAISSCISNVSSQVLVVRCVTVNNQTKRPSSFYIHTYIDQHG